MTLCPEKAPWSCPPAAHSGRSPFPRMGADCQKRAARPPGVCATPGGGGGREFSSSSEVLTLSQDNQSTSVKHHVRLNRLEVGACFCFVLFFSSLTIPRHFECTCFGTARLSESYSSQRPAGKKKIYIYIYIYMYRS